MWLKRGAEAELRKTEFLGRAAVEKVRVPKAYRLAALDEDLRRVRIRMEARLMSEARAAGVAVPVLYDINLVDNKIVMEFIDGPTVKEVLDRGGPEARTAAREIGRIAGRLHKAGIIHGDLTTSNMIRARKAVVFIDFGLGEVSSDAEKRGVDLHLMQRMLTSTHFRHAEELFAAFEDGYRSAMGDEAEEALCRMEEIERRGRYVERENGLDGDG